jgi:hypothetical protein
LSCSGASADQAREKARQYRRTAEQTRARLDCDPDPDRKLTRYRRFLVAAVEAYELRAEVEEKIAALYDRADGPEPMADVVDRVMSGAGLPGDPVLKFDPEG